MYEINIHGSEISRKTISVFSNDKIESKFGNKPCFVGGLKVDNRFTFGDYQIPKFGIIYVYNCSCQTSIK